MMASNGGVCFLFNSYCRNYKLPIVMKRIIMLLAVCLSLSVVGNAQTKKPVRKTNQTRVSRPVTKAPETPSANGKFKFDWTKGLVNDIDEKDFIVISAPGKSVNDIKSSVVSTLSDMYPNPSKVISTFGDNIINVTGYYADDVFWILENEIVKIYHFNYNIKIEIKEGKIKVGSPAFSNITERRQSGSYVLDRSHIDLTAFFSFLRKSKDSNTFCTILTDLFNSHVSKIVEGLSSNSNW